MKKSRWLGVLLAILTAAFTPAAGASEEGRDYGRHAWPLGIATRETSRVLLVREGTVVPTRALVAIEHEDQEVHFTVSTGSARFGDGATVALQKSGANQSGRRAAPK